MENQIVPMPVEELARLRDRDERLKAMMPLFEEARDALCAISEVSARLHNVRLDLADRMDDVGIPDRWRARKNNTVVCSNCDTAMPEGCGGIFEGDGDVCLRTRSGLVTT